MLLAPRARKCLTHAAAPSRLGALARHFASPRPAPAAMGSLGAAAVSVGTAQELGKLEKVHNARDLAEACPRIQPGERTSPRPVCQHRAAPSPASCAGSVNSRQHLCTVGRARSLTASRRPRRRCFRGAASPPLSHINSQRNACG